MRWTILLLAAVCAATTTAAWADTRDRDAQRRDLSLNRALWTRQGLGNYRFRLHVHCYCPDAARAVTITVRNGRPRGARGYQKQFDTVPELFQAIRRGLEDPRSGDVSISYDRRRGFPRTASIDRIKNAIDDEIGWTVDRFRTFRAADPGRAAGLAWAPASGPVVVPRARDSRSGARGLEPPAPGCDGPRWATGVQELAICS